MKDKKKRENHSILESIISLTGISIVIICVSLYFVFNEKFLGPVFLIFGIFTLMFLRMIKINPNHIYPDLIFGFVDNSLMVFAAIIGGSFGGVPGAVMGSVAGSTIADGISGFFEGFFSEELKGKKYQSKRSVLSSSLGKITGGLFGAGFSLTIVYLIKLIF